MHEKNTTNEFMFVIPLEKNYLFLSDIQTKYSSQLTLLSVCVNGSYLIYTFHMEEISHESLLLELDSLQEKFLL